MGPVVGGSQTLGRTPTSGVVRRMRANVQHVLLLHPCSLLVQRMRANVQHARLLAPCRLLVQTLGPGINRSHGASPSIRAHLYSEARCRSVARRRHRMSPDILKCKRGRHLSCQACCQAADLRVDVSEVGKRCPTAHPHDRAVRRPTKLHGHGPTGPEAVRRYPV